MKLSNPLVHFNTTTYLTQHLKSRHPLLSLDEVLIATYQHTSRLSPVSKVRHDTQITHIKRLSTSTYGHYHQVPSQPCRGLFLFCPTGGSHTTGLPPNGLRQENVRETEARGRVCTILICFQLHFPQNIDLRVLLPLASRARIKAPSQKKGKEYTDPVALDHGSWVSTSKTRRQCDWDTTGPPPNVFPLRNMNVYRNGTQVP